MSNINTNGINGNYPTPGVNNSTQGMRDNFTAIKNNLTITKDELTDLQNKVIVKSALEGTTLDNDMGGSVLANVQTKSFRASTWPISAGNMESSVLIDVSKGDVQYGNVVQNTTISFGGWAPTGTQSSVQLNLNIANTSAIIQLPTTTFNASNVIISGMKTSVRQVENYSANANPAPSTTIANYLTIPAGVTELQLKFSTVDCGSTIDITPINRNQVASRIDMRVPGKEGAPGDMPGAICTNGTNLYVCVGTYDGSTTIWGYVPLLAVT
jgi:hypothetical protein